MIINSYTGLLNTFSFLHFFRFLHVCKYCYWYLFLHSISDGWDVKCFKDNNPLGTHRPFIWGSQLSRLKWAVLKTSKLQKWSCFNNNNRRPFYSWNTARKTPNNQSFRYVSNGLFVFETWSLITYDGACIQIEFITCARALWKCVCTHRRSYEITSFEREQSNAYIYIFKTFPKRYF